jgi:HKD family nuclease
MAKETEEFLCSGDFFTSLQKLAKKSSSIRVAVAYLTQGGYDQIETCLRRFLGRSAANRLYFVVGLSDYCITEPSALESLLELKTDFENQLVLKYYDNEAFHPKLFVFEGKDTTTAIAGSSNLTWQGMSSNVEANLLLTRPTDSPIVQSIMNYFQEIDDYADTDLNDVLKAYKKKFNSFERKGGRKSGKTKRKGRRKTRLPPVFFPKISTSEARKQDMLWKISPGEEGCYWDHWVDPDGNGIIAIGWDDKEIGRLTDYDSEEELKDYIDCNRWKWGRYWRRRGPNGGLKDPSGYVAMQLWRFKKTAIGQMVAAYSKRTLFAVGEIRGNYHYDQGSEYFGHTKKVKWLAVLNKEISDPDMLRVLGGRHTIFPVTDSTVVRKTLKMLAKK